MPKQVLIGPGDDMGMVRVGGRDGVEGVVGGANVLAAVDQVIEGVHYEVGTPWKWIARKAIRRNVSDIAAMACKPTAALASVVLPRSMRESDVKVLFDAMREDAERWGCPLMGGDIAMHDGPMVLSVTVLAEPWVMKGGSEASRVIERSGAKVGDALCVTGQLGGSLIEGVGEEGQPWHLAFEPRVEQAKLLLKTLGDQLHAMIDISDGLGKDLPRVCEASGVSAEVRLQDLPVREASRKQQETRHQPSWWGAVSDGEDYELLIAMDAGAVVQAQQVIGQDVGLTVIGKVIDSQDDAVVWLENGQPITLHKEAGWEHEA